MFVWHFCSRYSVLLLLFSATVSAQTLTAMSTIEPSVSHQDPIEFDPSLTLAKVVDLTLEKHPDRHWLQALEDEAAALAKRSKSWTAGASQAGLRFQEATSGTLHYVDATVQVPLWNIGQRDAERSFADQAETSAELQILSSKLRVAGLVRGALWDMELQKIRYEQSKADLDMFVQLLNKVARRVELGDLPPADILLAKTEILQKKAIVTMAEAELMHARKRYNSITQSAKAPANFIEELTPLTEIKQNHPALVAISSQIERKQAELKTVKLIGSGQNNVAVGINSDRPSNNDPRSNKTESFNIAVNVPFGGEAHLAPHLAAINVEVNRLIAEREQLLRDLEQAHHEAEHNLEVNQAEKVIADELKQVAEQSLEMTELSFSVGEIDLLDLLKIQARTQQAVLNAKERDVILQRDKAIYNQAVGVLP